MKVLVIGGDGYCGWATALHLSKKGYEMFPNAIVEAMTYGNCFVATNTQGVPETAQNNEGVICD